MSRPEYILKSKFPNIVSWRVKPDPKDRAYVDQVIDHAIESARKSKEGLKWAEPIKAAA